MAVHCKSDFVRDIKLDCGLSVHQKDHDRTGNRDKHAVEVRP
jgi:hypothetical protein